MKTRAPAFEYILGDSSYEVKRLAFQAGVWRDMTEGLLDRLKVGPGWKCLELGPGTGTTFLPLADRVRGRGGAVDGVERSPRYAAYLGRKLRAPRYSHARVFEGDILDVDLPRGRYDLIFARWVFIFLPKVEEHLRRLKAALKPGGLLAIEDYHRTSIAMYPPPPEWDTIMKADKAWFRSQGGDLNIAGRLPALLRKTGFDIVEVTPHMKTGFPDSDMWKWVEAYFLTYLDEMAKFPPGTKKAAAAFRRGWLRLRKDPSTLFISPTMLDVVGRKRR